jgi:glutathione S-transferase
MTLVIYGDRRSGNCLKVLWTADRLGLAYDWVEVDAFAGETRRPEFRALNPAAQVPTVLLTDGRNLAQSNAILLHIAEGSDLIPADPFWRAKMLEWLFWEQSSHEPYLSVRRAGRPRIAEVERKAAGQAALARMESWLTGSPFLVAGRLTLADIALLPHTRQAAAQGFDLEALPAIRQWIARCEAELGLSPGLSVAA